MRHTRRILLRITHDLAPFVCVFIAQWYGSELVMLGAVILASAITLRRGYRPGEGTLFIIGVVIGVIIEVCLGLVYRDQYWEHASLLGVPLWLPFMWGYAFVVMRRVGDLIVR